MHTCGGLGGLTAPMVLASEVGDVQVVSKVREDYVCHEHPVFDVDGRPVSAVETQYSDGHTDLAVLAPVANSGKGYSHDVVG